jgi:mRNA interferase MazF
VARILRGDVRWADLNSVRDHEHAGQRPVLVLSHDVFNERSGTVIAVAMTSQEPRAGFPLTVESSATGLNKRSWIKVSQIRLGVVIRVSSGLRSIRAPGHNQHVNGNAQQTKLRACVSTRTCCRRSISRSAFTDPIRATHFCNVENRDFLPDLP